MMSPLDAGSFRNTRADGELSAVFRCIEETEAKGRPKFSPATCRRLERLVASRAYAKRLTELCHLVVAAASCEPRSRFENFFWASGPATATVYRSYFDRAARSGLMRPPVVEAGRNGIVLRYGPARHEIAFSRMPLLAAFAEFLATALGYAEMDRLLDPLLRENIDKRSVEKASNALARAVHAYLAPRLPSAQNLRKFRRMTDFLSRRNGTSATSEAIDDAAIMDFWVEESPNPAAETLGFRTYRSVFKSFVCLRFSLVEARNRYRLDHPRSLSGPPETGGIDPESVFESLETIDEAPDPIRSLAEPPLAPIKFFNRRERRELAELLFPGRLKEPLVLSVLRNGVFGDAQLRLTNAVQGGIAEGALERTIERCLDDDYPSRIKGYERLADRSKRLLLASLYVLIRSRRLEAIEAVTALNPDMDMSPLKTRLTDGGNDEAIIRLSAPSFVEWFLQTFDRHPEELGNDAAALASEARRAYRSISRQGFREDDPKIGALAEGFGAATAPLIRIWRDLQRFMAVLGPPADWKGRFLADRTAFSRQFRSIYGDNDGPAPP